LKLLPPVAQTKGKKDAPTIHNSNENTTRALKSPHPSQKVMARKPKSKTKTLEKKEYCMPYIYHI
jgi:hypothetical protein